MGLHACREGGRGRGEKERERERERERGALTIRHKHSSLNSLRVRSKVDTHGTCTLIHVGNTVVFYVLLKPLIWCMQRCGGLAEKFAESFVPLYKYLRGRRGKTRPRVQSRVCSPDQQSRAGLGLSPLYDDLQQQTPINLFFLNPICEQSKHT